jgi:hypothetical protein
MAAFAASILLVLSSGVAFGSGSYSGRPSNPGISIDRASYELGKKVFAGQFPRSDQAGDAAVQLELLENLQNRLPLKARAGVSLVNYAGQLDDEQVEALQYFLKKRYKVE